MEEFEIEFVKFKEGKYEFQHEINVQFFEAFQNPDVQSADVKVALVFEKQRHIMQVDLDMQGLVGVACDRCLEVLNWPVKTKYRLIYKLSEEHMRAEATESDGEVELCLLEPNAISINVSQAIYESVLLDIPMIRNCDNLEVKPCNNEMLNKLANLTPGEEGESDPRWDKLKDLLK